VSETGKKEINMIYPNFVYKGVGRHFRKGGTYDYTQVLNDADLTEKMQNGWHESLLEAMEAEDSKDSIKVEDEPETSVPAKRRGRPKKVTDGVE